MKLLILKILTVISLILVITSVLQKRFRDCNYNVSEGSVVDLIPIRNKLGKTVYKMPIVSIDNANRTVELKNCDSRTAVLGKRVKICHSDSYEDCFIYSSTYYYKNIVLSSVMLVVSVILLVVA